MSRFAFLTLLLLVAPAAAADYPTRTLKSNNLTVTVFEPDAEKGMYRGARFDWSGVFNVTFDGHKLYGPWLGEPSPKNPDSIVGPCEEFGMFTTPPGYDTAKVGETFLKIGVGQLEKPKEDGYRFLHGYKVVKPGTWVMTTRDGLIAFTQSVKTAAGYGYLYSKTVAVKGDTLTISHKLENTGIKLLHTDHYNHNFFNVDGDAVGPNYELEFPFVPTAVEPKDRFAEVVKFDGKKLTLTAALDKGTLHAGLTGFDATAATAGVTLRHKPSGVTVRVTGDRPVTRFNVWAMKTTLCPEPFVELKIKPGQSAAWQWKYEFSK
ncbi:hypothetical protein [Limnoglobus roseus]|uniref:Uncharacterized protein n=1 Tax=Limnoglobus roseus TaxID=2598579 RepID=A0A5C1A885_9BACT|nr:hypothetical protein [Limnoglobus roseus]QEL14960.1 hypothetical protein PX52LOC_01863 [Limnoglobus roseus]